MAEHTLTHGQISRLLMQHRTALYGYIFACVRHHDDAEDILQIVCVAVAESIGQLRDESGFLPWAREIARRRILAHRRTVGREQPVDPQLLQRLAEAAERVERTEPTSNLRAALRACLETLPPQSRQLMLLRYGEATSRAEAIATDLGRSVQSVYAQVKRIKAALRACVERRLTAEGHS